MSHPGLIVFLSHEFGSGIKVDFGFVVFPKLVVHGPEIAQCRLRPSCPKT